MDHFAVEIAMRLLSMIVGIILLVAGIWVLAGHPTYTSTDTAAKLGPLELQTTQDKAVPTWTGIAGVVVGGILLIGGLASKRGR
ncbi:MAG TPA: hypothetical protein VFJ15_04770 [Oleiagrimonas sp.]|nr:hypothetical protein [Oleiagrimonas sp.]